MSTQPYASPAPTPTAAYDLAGVFQPLADKAGWIKFIGIWTILIGILYCITIIGAIVGVPLVIAGLNLSQAATLLKASYANDGTQLHEACQKIATSFFIAGILLAIYLALMLLYLVVMIALAIGGGFGAMNFQ